MAITSASFVPERRKGGSSSAAHGSPMHGADADYNHATDSAMSAMHETMPAEHPVTSTPLPKATGAGKGAIRKGGRGGK